MKIALDISPIDSSSKSAHKVRGVGKYISLLKDNLEKFDKKNTYIFSSNIKIDSEKADIVHYPYFDPFFVTFPLNKKKKTIITVHDLIPLKYKSHFPSGIKGSFSWQINKRILKSADLVISNSNATKKQVMDLIGVEENKIKIVYLGVSSHFKKVNVSDADVLTLKRKFNIPEKFFLYVGDVTWNKNLPSLIKAIKKQNIPLVMVGKALISDYDRLNPWNKDRNFVEENTNSNLFIKTGFLKDDYLVKLYNLSLALCMPSYDEGFGFPVLEGMSCGAPVLVSKNGSLPEVAGDAGYYVESHDMDDISKKLENLGNDDNLRRDLSEKSLKQAEKFSIQKTIEETVDVYEHLV